MELRAALRRVHFLKNLPEPAQEAIMRAGKELRLAKGEMLFAERERCLGLIVVLTGAVKVYKLDSRGRELTLDREIPGESVAELPLFDGGNYPASAEAAEEETTVFIVPRERFHELIVDYPQIAEEGLRALAIRMRKLIQMLEAQSLHTVRVRLADYLLRVADDRTVFRLEETNEAIGSHIGTVREVVSRTLRSLKDAGYLSLSGRTVCILQGPALQRVADSEAEE